MALWGDKDNISVGTGATAYISSYTKNETYGGYPVVGADSVWAVSYTHLTLPTILLV